MKYLITGGLGYIGSVFSSLAAERGHRCVVVDRDASKKNMFAGFRQGVEVVIADLLDLETLRELLATHRPQVVHHFAAISAVAGYTEEKFQENVQTTTNLLSAIAEFEPRVPLIFASTCAVYGDCTEVCDENTPPAPRSAYGRSKHECEELVRKSAIPAVILRYSNVGGAVANFGERRENETHLIPNSLNAALAGTDLTIFGKNLATKDGSAMRDYVHVRDVAEVHLLLSEGAGEKCKVFNVCAGASHSNHEIVNTVQRTTGKDVRVNIAPPRQGDVAAVHLSNTKLTHELGFVPQYSTLDEIVSSTYRFLIL